MDLIGQQVNVVRWLNEHLRFIKNEKPLVNKRIALLLKFFHPVRIRRQGIVLNRSNLPLQCLYTVREHFGGLFTSLCRDTAGNDKQHNQ